MMSPITVMFLAASMSVDAFAAAARRGAGVAHARWRDVVFAGMLFGAIEAMTPILGWLAGNAANDRIADYDHWVAFILLVLVGANAIRSAFSEEDETPARQGSKALIVLIATALGTSIDAMAVGLSLALVDVGFVAILVIAVTMGMTTFSFAVIGTVLGSVVGKKLGRSAGILAGLVLMAIGCGILIEHLTA